MAYPQPNKDVLQGHPVDSWSQSSGQALASSRRAGSLVPGARKSSTNSYLGALTAPRGRSGVQSPSRRPRPRGAHRGHVGSRAAPHSLPGVRGAMAAPSLRGRLARLGTSRKPVLKPNKPLILADRVGERRRERGGEFSSRSLGRPGSGWATRLPALPAVVQTPPAFPAEATCITEMSVMMACWKRNEFRDDACRSEIQNFFDCASKAEVTGSWREWGGRGPRGSNHAWSSKPLARRMRRSWEILHLSLRTV